MSVDGEVYDLTGSKIDYIDAMKLSVDKLALKDLTMLPSDIWIHVTDLLDHKSTVYKGLTNSHFFATLSN